MDYAIAVEIIDVPITRTGGLASMAKPTREQLQQWAKNYVALWNTGDKDGWVKNWKSVAPGDFRMLDPVGTPEKLGFDLCAAKSFDLFQPTLRFKVVEGSMFICDNEVAWFMENHFSADGGTTLLRSIETFRFEPDGSVVIRTYYDVPPPAKNDMGTLFEEYLPGRN